MSMLELDVKLPELDGLVKDARIIRTIRNTTALAACDYHGLRLRD